MQLPSPPPLYRFQPSVDVPGPVAPKNGTSPTDAQVAALVSKAHAMGITVMFRPCVDPVRGAALHFFAPLTCYLD